MISLLILVVCGLGMLILIAGVIIMIVLIRTGDRDVVSSARQGWLDRRSDHDKEGW